MNNAGKSIFCFINSDKAGVSAELPNLLYNKVEKNQELRIEIVK